MLRKGILLSLMIVCNAIGMCKYGLQRCAAAIIRPSSATKLMRHYSVNNSLGSLPFTQKSKNSWWNQYSRPAYIAGAAGAAGIGYGLMRDQKVLAEEQKNPYDYHNRLKSLDELLDQYATGDEDEKRYIYHQFDSLKYLFDKRRHGISDQDREYLIKIALKFVNSREKDIEKDINEVGRKELGMVAGHILDLRKKEREEKGFFQQCPLAVTNFLVDRMAQDLFLVNSIGAQQGNQVLIPKLYIDILKRISRHEYMKDEFIMSLEVKTAQYNESNPYNRTVPMLKLVRSVLEDINNIPNEDYLYIGKKQ
jgi:hypothetical protein